MTLITKHIAFTLLIFISSNSFCQSYNFAPEWNKGDSKTITIVQVEKEFEDDILISDTTIYNYAELKVLKENKNEYILEILFENQALKAAIDLYDGLGEELDEYQDLSLIYSIDKNTAEAELMNWEEAQQFMNNSIDQIENLIEEKLPEEAYLMRLIFMPIKLIFKDKESVEAYMHTNIGFILTPYFKDFKIDESIVSIDSEDNPFNQMQQISATTILTLVSVNEAEHNCIIKQDVELDLSEFIEMMKGMIMQMSEAFGANDSIAETKGAEMDSFEMDMTNSQEITFDYENSWVTEAISHTSIIGSDPMTGINSRHEVVITTTVK